MSNYTVYTIFSITRAIGYSLEMAFKIKRVFFKNVIKCKIGP